MLLGLRHPWHAGMTVPVVFRFADGELVSVNVPVTNRAF
jgi:copper(I)-binding protein